MRAIKRLWCLVIGHRGVRVITAAQLRDASLTGFGFTVTGHRWDCSRCGQRGIRLHGRTR